MALPGSTINILDGGLGVTTPASSRPHILGVFESGPLNTPTVIANQRQLKDTFGIHGPGNDLVGYILDVAGGPTIVTRVSPSIVALMEHMSTPLGEAAKAMEINPTAAPVNEADIPDENNEATE